MDRDYRNEMENAYFPSRMKRQNSETTRVHIAGDMAENNELHLSQDKSKATIVVKNVKSKVEKKGPKEKENSPKENLKSNTTATNNSQNSSKNFGDPKNLSVLKKSQQRKINSLKPFRKKFENRSSAQYYLDEINETFEVEDIIQNSIAVELIQDFVNCFTFNSTLPEKELCILKATLFEKACHMLINILNSCLKKIFNKVINSDFIQEIRKKQTSKKDACCQTSLSDIIPVEKTETQENVSPCLDVIF